jgi:nitrile hydratase
MWSIAMLTGAKGWTIDWWRHVRELIDPADYLTRRYFDQWMQTQTAAMIDSGVLTVQEVVAGGRVSARSATGSPMQRREVIEKVASLQRDYSRKIDKLPAFAKGDRIRARLMGATGHTRLPAYARGRIGMVHAHHGAHILPDASARGEKRAEHLYSIVFQAEILWPEASGRPDKVFLDLWESYLERP